MFIVTNNPNGEPTLEQLQKFYGKCRWHDWYYQYADDHRSYTAGRDASHELQHITTFHPKYKEIYNAWSEYKFSGAHTNTEKLPMPIRPE